MCLELHKNKSLLICRPLY